MQVKEIQIISTFRKFQKKCGNAPSIYQEVSGLTHLGNKETTTFLYCDLLTIQPLYDERWKIFFVGQENMKWKIVEQTNNMNWLDKYLDSYVCAISQVILACKFSCYSQFYVRANLWFAL